MPSAVSWERLSAEVMPSFRRSQAAGGLVQVWLPGVGHGRLGGFSMLNISASPNVASACSLSQVLEGGAIPPRYFLSPRACRGILRRAWRREKALPDALFAALARVAFGGRLPALFSAAARLGRHDLVASQRR